VREAVLPAGVVLPAGALVRTASLICAFGLMLVSHG